jgi:hypothetical protein
MIFSPILCISETLYALAQQQQQQQQQQHIGQVHMPYSNINCSPVSAFGTHLMG